MTDRDLMQQALEALENAEDQLPKPYSTDAREAITALRERLAQPESCDPQIVWCDCGDGITPNSGAKCGNCIAAESPIEQPEQEPVAGEYATCLEDGERVLIASVLPVGYGGNKTRTIRVVWSDGADGVYTLFQFAKLFSPVGERTTTPRREWVGLTEAEKVNVAIACGCADVAWMDFADAIEAKLKEKNA